MSTYEQNMAAAMSSGYNDTDSIDQFLAVTTAHDETYALNNHLEAYDAFMTMLAESGIATERDDDSLYALRKSLSECGGDNPECDFGYEPVENYDGERNDRYEFVCRTHN